MDRKRKWDEPAEPSLDGAAAAVDSPLKVPKTEDSHAASHSPTTTNDGADKAAEAAAAIAARLASQYRGGGGGGGPPPPPGSAPPPPPGGGGSTAAGSFGGVGHKGERDRDREAGLHVEDIEINDLRNRYLLTKGPTQQQILADTGANVLTRGVWYPDKSMATEKDPPLYLHITGDTPEKLEAGVKAVRALIDQDLNLLAGGPRGRHMGGPPGQQGGPDGDRDSGYGQRRRWPEEKVMIDLEPLRNFNVRAKVVGPGGMFVKYIQQETGTRVQIKGQGSGYIETDTGRESDDPMHINIAGPEPQQIERAVELAKDLLEVIREKHAEALQQGPPQFGGPLHHHGGGGGGYGGGFQPSGPNGYGGPGGRFGGPGGPPQQMDPYAQQQQQNPYNYQPNQYAGAGLTAPLPPGEAPPPPPSAAGGEQQQQGATSAAAPAGGAAASGMSNEQYMAWWNSLDAASQAYYTQYYAAYAQYAANPAAAGGTPQGASAGASASPAPPSSAPPPPPPPSDAPPPPPPAGNEGGGSGRYGAVPPPAGL